MPQFTCPHCRKTLRTASAIPAGKKIKCPACAQTFAAPEDEATAIQAPSNVPAKSSPKRPRAEAEAVPVDDDNDRPHRPKVEDDDVADLPRRSRHERDDGAEDDEQPRRKGKQKSKGSALLLILLPLIGLGLLSCIFLGVGAFVWPGFLKPGGGAAAGNNNNDPFAFLPADDNFILAVNLNRLREQGKLEPLVQDLQNPPQVGGALPFAPGVRLPFTPPPGMPPFPDGFGGPPGIKPPVVAPGTKGGPKGIVPPVVPQPPAAAPARQVKPMPPELADVVRDGELLLVSVRADAMGDESAPVYMAIKTRGKLDQEKIKRASGAAAAEPVKALTVYRADLEQSGKPGLLAFPGDNFVIISRRDPGSFAQTVEAAEKRGPHPAQELIGEVRSADIWGVLQFDAGIKQKLQQNAGDLQKLPGVQLNGLMNAMQQGKGLGFTFERVAEPPSYRARINLYCATDADAASAKSDVQGLWGVAQLALAMGGGKKDAGAAAFNELARGLTFEAEKNRASVVVNLSEQAWQGMQKK